MKNCSLFWKRQNSIKSFQYFHSINACVVWGWDGPGMRWGSFFRLVCVWRGLGRWGGYDAIREVGGGGREGYESVLTLWIELQTSEIHRPQYYTGIFNCDNLPVDS